MATELRTVDGQGLTLYNTDNTKSSLIKMDVNDLRLDPAGGAVLLGKVGTASNLVFEESSSITGQGTNTISLGVSGDIFNLNVAGVTYNLGTIAGNVTFSGNLTVTGTTTFNGNVSFAAAKTLTVGTGATSLGGTLGVTGATILSSTLSVTGVTTFNGNVTFAAAKTLTVGTGATSLGGTLGVTGATTLSSTLAVTGAVTMANASLIKGTGTGVANIAFLQFMESNGTTRTGWIGDGNGTSSSIELGADVGNIVLVTDVTVLTAKRGGGIDITGNTSTSGRMGIGQAAHTAADAVLAITVPTTGTVTTGTDKYGGIHLQQTTTTGEFVGITASGHSTVAGTMAGILFQGSDIASAARTQIHFLTADSFTNGMQNRMTLDYTGNLGIGTITPSTSLHIKQALGVGTTRYDMTLQSGNDGSNTRHGIEFRGSDTNVEARIVTGNYGSFNGSIGFETGASAVASTTTTQRLLINFDGKIALGNFVPTISLAIGDTDTGLNWTADGSIQLYSNNISMIALSGGNAIALNKNTSVVGTSTLTVGTGATFLGGTLAVTGATTLTGALSANSGMSIPIGKSITMDTASTEKGRLFTIAGINGWMGWTMNAQFNGSGWVLDNTANPGWFFKLDTRPTSTEWALYKIPAGAGTHTDESVLFNITAAGNSTMNANLTLGAGNTLTVGTGATSLGGTLGVTGAATLSSTLNVIGLTSVSTITASTIVNTPAVKIASKFTIQYNATEDSLDFVYG
jgi:fibronectin-binding autotransporter adhesin